MGYMQRKVPVIEKQNFVIYLEDDQGFLFIHCDCDGWSKDVKNELLIDLKALMEVVNKEIYAIHEIDDVKHRKFLKICGFDYFKDFVGTDGKLRQIFVRRR